MSGTQFSHARDKLVYLPLILVRHTIMLRRTGHTEYSFARLIHCRASSAFHDTSFRKMTLDTRLLAFHITDHNNRQEVCCE